MKDVCYLVFDRHGVRSMKKNPPKLERGEYAVKIRVDIPDAYFATAIPTVEVTVTESAVIAPKVEVLEPEPEVHPEDELVL